VKFWGTDHLPHSMLSENWEEIQRGQGGKALRPKRHGLEGWDQTTEELLFTGRMGLTSRAMA
jgi:hypothetical protein